MNGQILTISADEYHAGCTPIPALSNSIAKVLLDQSPAHAWLNHSQLNPNYKPSESSRFDLGIAAHDLILEGGTAKICVIQPEDYRSKPTKAEPEGAIPKGWTNNAIRDARDQARSNGLVPVLPWDYAATKHMVDVAHKFIAGSELAGIFGSNRVEAKGKPEQTITWQEGGQWCKARLDWLTDDYRIILDYKTTDSAEPEAFIRQIGRMGYDMQAAFYSRGLEAVTGKKAIFVFLAQEIEPPYACSLVALSNAFIEIADAKASQAIAIWTDCMVSNNWPAYSGRIHYAEPAGWQLQKHMERTQDNEIESGDWQS
jgi:hypothetical protein